ncbi:hypothetical protein GCM10027073_20780 [Streptomyces chlorus]|uniref:Translation initiation factor IF-2 n=1 Tax=Streptomyces chlorus TaxID=887452 RepID=A0ABW1E723_9ACTN
MEQWREDAQPEWSETEDEVDLVEDERPASGSFAADHGTWFSRGVPGRTAEANDVTAARTAPRAVGPDDRADLNDRADLDDRVAPDDTKATMSTTPPPGGTSKVPAPGGTSRMPAQRGPEKADRAERATPTPPVASEGPEDPEETRVLRIKPRTTPTPPSTGFTARLSAQSPGTPRPPRSPLRDPWQEGAGTTAFAPVAAASTLPVPAPTKPVPAAGAAADADTTEHTHDPHEVTVQLDAVQFGDGVLRATPGKHRVGGPDVADGPVFVDESGRRSRLYRRIGLAVGLACAGYAIVIVATLLSGNSNAPWVPVPGQEEEQPAGKVETSPQPAEPDASPGSGTDLTPGAEPTAGEVDTLPSPGASLPVGGVTVPEAESGETTGPSSTPTRATPGPGTGVGGPTTTAPADPPATSEPAAPTTPSGGTGTVPTTPPAGEDPGGEEPAGVDNVAQAPAEPPAVAAENPVAQPDPSTAPAVPFPEHVL